MWFFFRIRTIYFDAIAWQTISKFTNFAGEVIQHKEALDQKHEEQKYDENEVNGNFYLPYCLQISSAVCLIFFNNFFFSQNDSR